MHLLWADDLILISDSVNGLQKHLNGLYKICKMNLTIVNEIKIKCMAFGKIKKCECNFQWPMY